MTSISPVLMIFYDKPIMEEFINGYLVPKNIEFSKTEKLLSASYSPFNDRDGDWLFEVYVFAPFAVFKDISDWLDDESIMHTGEAANGHAIMHVGVKFPFIKPDIDEAAANSLIGCIVESVKVENDSISTDKTKLEVALWSHEGYTAVKIEVTKEEHAFLEKLVKIVEKTRDDDPDSFGPWLEINEIPDKKYRCFSEFESFYFKGTKVTARNFRGYKTIKEGSIWIKMEEYPSMLDESIMITVFKSAEDDSMIIANPSNTYLSHFQSIRGE